MPTHAIVLLIIAGIIALITWILSLRFHVYIKGENTDIAVRFKLLFYTKKLYPDKTTPEDYIKKKKKKKKKPAQKKNFTPKKKKRDILGVIRFITHLIKRLYAKFPQYFKLKLKRAVVVIGGEDAAETALRYGAVRAATAYLLTACETLFTFQTPRSAVLLIEPNFLTEESRCEIDIDLSVSLFSTLKLLMRSLIIYQSHKKNKTTSSALQTKNRAES